MDPRAGDHRMPFVGNLAKGYREYFVDWMVNCRRTEVHDPRRRYGVHEQFGLMRFANTFARTMQYGWKRISFLRFYYQDTVLTISQQKLWYFWIITLDSFKPLIENFQINRIYIVQVYQTTNKLCLLGSKFVKCNRGKRKIKAFQLYRRKIKCITINGSRYESKETTFHRSTQFPLLIKSLNTSRLTPRRFTGFQDERLRKSNRFHLLEGEGRS